MPNHRARRFIWEGGELGPLGLVLGVLLGALAGCSSSPPNVILVVIDSLRPDHLGAYGYTRPTSPNIDAFAAGATTFTQASSPSSWTKPSIGSLFTSRYPSEHGALSYGTALAPAPPTLAGRLAEAGYQAIAVVGNFVHLTEGNGFARGFDAWETVARAAPSDSAVSQWPPLATAINERVFARLDAAGERPLLLYVHYMEPHTPWTPPRESYDRFERTRERPGFADTAHVVELASGRRDPELGETEWLVDLYDAEIAAVDAAFGVLLDGLGERGWLDDAVVVLTADHGEEFADHGRFFHGHSLHAELLRVPLILRTPGQRTAMRRDEPVDLLDVPTTLLDAVGIAPAAGMRGRSLLADGPLPPRQLRAELYPETSLEAAVGERLDRVALRDGGWKSILDRNGGLRSYRLDGDPAETRPVAGGQEPATLREAVGEAAQAFARPTVSLRRELGQEDLEALRALGYAE